jgi:hypothetical protein
MVENTAKGEWANRQEAREKITNNIRDEARSLQASAFANSVGYNLSHFRICNC